MIAGKGQPVPPPEEWAALEASFSAALRSPLVVAKGRLSSPSEFGALEASLAGPSGHEGLALYHEQHWMRLFNALQQGAARVAGALGYFHFNRLAERWLHATPPREVDLGALVDGLLPWLEHELATAPERVLGELPLDSEALLECLAFDRAERRASTTSASPVWRPGESELLRIARTPIQYAPSFSLLIERFAVKAGTRSPEAAFELVPRSAPRYVTCVRVEGAVVMRRVEPLFAELLQRASHTSLEAILEDWAARLSPQELDRLRNNLPRFTRQAVTDGYWVGLQG